MKTNEEAKQQHRTLRGVNYTKVTGRHQNASVRRNVIGSPGHNHASRE